MHIEHVAFSVTHPAEAAAWYARHLGFKVVRALTASPFTHFIADGSGRVMLEFYCFPNVKPMDYRSMDPLLVHVAFVSGDVNVDRARLLAAGATAAGEVTTSPAGDQLAMLRDPWGLAIQLVKRAQPMV